MTITRSQDHKITIVQEQGTALSSKLLASLSLVFLISAGCTSPVDSVESASQKPLESTKGQRKSSTQIDLGIVFSDEESYFCFPFEKFGNDPSQEIREIKSSCDCVIPSAIRYRRRETEMGTAIRLDFAVQPTKLDSQNSASQGVEIKLCFSNAKEQSLMVTFLQTVC